MFNISECKLSASHDTYPFGRLPRARINWSIRNVKYPIFNRLLTIGVTSLLKGHDLNLFAPLGVPTISRMTELVSQ